MNWDSQLQALAHLRKQQNVHLNRPVAFILVGIFVFLGLWFKFGFQNTIGIFGIVGFFAFNFLMRKQSIFNSKWSQTQVQLEAQSSRLEERILQSVVESNHSFLRFKMAAPNIAHEFRSADLIRQKIDYIDQTRCLTGVHQATPFCATYTEAGYFDSYQDSEGRTQKIPKPIFRGLFIIADFSKVKSGWLVLSNDKLEKLGWLANEWRQIGDSSHVRMENVDFERHFNVQASSPVDAHLTLTPDVMERLAQFSHRHAGLPFAMSLKDQTVKILLPMTTNPFVIRDNPDLWPNELSNLQEISSTLADLLKAFDDTALTRSKAAS